MKPDVEIIIDDEGVDIIDLDDSDDSRPASGSQVISKNRNQFMKFKLQSHKT